MAIFRLFFGAMMAYSLIRFFSKGWINSFYITPDVHFSYYLFEWVKPLGDWTYLLFFICFISSILVMLGWFYRIAAIVFFLSFTYIELMDKTTYLNHYYFTSLVAFLFIFLPANTYFSIDAYRNKRIRNMHVPKWNIDAIKLMLAVVYFYAGLAKLNSDWLLNAQPLATWLSTKTFVPIIGKYMTETWFHYLFSWSGCLFDLSIPFLLFYRKSRPVAYIFVIFFHLMTSVLFPIGMFPFIMIVSTIIFFDNGFHQKIIVFITRILGLKKIVYTTNEGCRYTWQPFLIGIFFAIQLLFPFRYIMYPGELFWHEQGFRFSWRVMLVEKTGLAEFTVLDEENNKTYTIYNKDHLSTLQIKQMSTQADFILQYAHYIADFCKKKYKVKNPKVFVESYVSLNGRRSTRFIKPDVNLVDYTDSWKNKTFIIPFKEKIHGL